MEEIANKFFLCPQMYNFSLDVWVFHECCQMKTQIIVVYFTVTVDPRCSQGLGATATHKWLKPINP